MIAYWPSCVFLILGTSFAFAWYVDCLLMTYSYTLKCCKRLSQITRNLSLWLRLVDSFPIPLPLDYRLTDLSQADLESYAVRGWVVYKNWSKPNQMVSCINMTMVFPHLVYRIAISTGGRYFATCVKVYHQSYWYITIHEHQSETPKCVAAFPTQGEVAALSIGYLTRDDQPGLVVSYGIPEGSRSDVPLSGNVFTDPVCVLIYPRLPIV